MGRRDQIKRYKSEANPSAKDRLLGILIKFDG